MSWRYENYGTITTDPSCKVETPHSKFGFAYKVNGRVNYAYIPKTATELWAKCDAYFTDSYSDGDRIAMGNTDYNDDGKDCGFWSRR